MWPFTRKKDPRANHDFNEDDRELSARVRLLKTKEKELDFERKRLEHDVQMARLQSELDEIRGMSNDDGPEPEGNSTDAMMMLLMSKLFAAPGVAAQQIAPPNPPTSEFSDDQLREILAQIPKQYLKIARGMNDETLAGLIRGRMPGIGQDTINRAIAMVRS